MHYKWHWYWDWGTGELGNNGVHSLDLCRWALGVEYPERVVSSGGRLHFDDDQETPDTQLVGFDFPGDKRMSWEGLSCNRRGIDGTGFGASIHGTDGSIVIGSREWVRYDHGNREVAVSFWSVASLFDITKVLLAVEHRPRMIETV